MAKMTDKKPGKAKAKAEGQGDDQGQGEGRPAQAKPAFDLTPAVHQPGVERRKNHPTRAKDGQMQSS